jgi:acetyl-CoA synthetase
LNVLLFIQGRELKGNNVSGALCFRSAGPGMCRTIYGHHDRYLDTYYRPYPGKSIFSSLSVIFELGFPSLPNIIKGLLLFDILPGFYFTGDGALRDKDGDYRITGRMDDVINVSGKRLGTAEVEDAMVSFPVLFENRA